MKWINEPIILHVAYGLGWRHPIQKVHGNGTPCFRSVPAPVVNRREKSMKAQGFRKKQNLKLHRPPARLRSERMLASGADIQPCETNNEDEAILELVDDVLVGKL